MTNQNEALWMRSTTGPFEVSSAPVPNPGPGEVVVQVHAVAINPADAIRGPLRSVVTPWVRYPSVIGTDIAGEVIAVGPEVDGIAEGDRVAAFAAGQERSRQRNSEGGFQRLVVVLARVCIRIPIALSFVQAAVLPLGLATAAAGLYEQDQLALPLPASGASVRDEVVLVWGASTSVGCNAVQLARASGYTVLATAGPQNHQMVRSLGAEAVVDYKEPGVESKLQDALGGRRLAGTIAIGAGALTYALRITRSVPGARQVASVYPDPVTKVRSLLARTRGILVTSIWGGTPVVSDVGPAIFRDFMPGALSTGSFHAAPRPTVIGRGLEAIPHALDIMRGGVSGERSSWRSRRDDATDHNFGARGNR